MCDPIELVEGLVGIPPVQKLANVVGIGGGDNKANNVLPGQAGYGDTDQARERARLQAMTAAGYRATFASGPRGPGGPEMNDQNEQLNPDNSGSQGSIDHRPRGGGPVPRENPPGSIDERPRSTRGSGSQTPEMDPEEMIRRARRMAPYFGERRAWYEQ